MDVIKILTLRVAISVIAVCSDSQKSHSPTRNLTKAEIRIQ